MSLNSITYCLKMKSQISRPTHILFGIKLRNFS